MKNHDAKNVDNELELLPVYDHSVELTDELLDSVAAGVPPTKPSCTYVSCNG